jgi:hypothetical protein
VVRASLDGFEEMDMYCKSVISIASWLILAVGRLSLAEDIAMTIADLHHRDWERQFVAERTIRRLANQRAEILQGALPKIASTFHHGDQERTLSILQLMQHRGYNLRPIVPELVGFLQTDDSRTLCDLLLLLGDLGPDANRATPRLRELFDVDRTPDIFVCTRAACALARIDVSRPEYIDSLIYRLSARDDLERWLAADGLGRVGRPAVRATASLNDSLADTDLTVRCYAAIALWRINGNLKPVLPTLIRALHEEGAPCYLKPIHLSAWQPTHGMQVARFLGAVRPPATEAIPGLLARFYRESDDVDDRIMRSIILRSLNRISPRDPRVLMVTHRALNDRDAYLRSTAQEVLRERDVSTVA